MSIKLIDSSKTTYTTRHGIGGYLNPAINVVQMVDGRLYNDDRQSFLKNTTDMVNIIFKETGNPYATSFTALFCALHGLQKTRSDRTLLIYNDVGWRPYNAVHINQSIIRMIKNKTFISMAIETKTLKDYNIAISILTAMGYIYDMTYESNYIYTSSKGIINSTPFLNESNISNISLTELIAVFQFYKECNKNNNIELPISNDHVNESTDNILSADDVLTLNDIGITEIKTKSIYITEDGLHFTEEKDAKLHQLNVDKGKEAAHLVVAKKAGYELAEQIYRLSVKYSGRPPYDDFKCVLSNENGVQFVNGNSKYEFEDRPYLGSYRQQILNRQFERNDAIKIAKSLVSLNTNIRDLNSILN